MPDNTPNASLPELSLVVPLHNEANAVESFAQRAESVLEKMGVPYEIVCVNGGSADATLDKLLAWRERNPRVKILDLSRDFGKEAALSAGLDCAAGAAVVPIDADLQDPPELIPRLREKWKEGYEVVQARRVSRLSESPAKRLSAGWFYRVYNLISNDPIPPNTGDFRLMDRRVVEAVKRLPERSRFMKGLFAWVGYRRAQVDYERPARSAGRSKWGYWRLWNFALGGIFAFSTLPLRIWSYLGFLISVFTFFYACFLIARTLILGIDVPGYASLMVVVLFLGGIQLITLGILGEYLGKIYDEVKQRPLYIVRRSYGLKLKPAPSALHEPADA